MGDGVESMARPKGRPAKKTVQTPTTSAGQDERETVVHMKGSPAYVKWLDDINKKTYIPKVQLVRIALAEWAERHRHPKPPEI